MLVLGTACLLTSSFPASAIFGLSKCEKVERRVLKEESVGRQLWRSYDSWRDALDVRKPMSWGEVLVGLGKLNLVYESDLKVFKIANRNKSCFSTTTLATIREQQSKIDGFEESFETLKDTVYSKSLANQLADKRFTSGFVSDYKSFSSIYSYDK
jgi:hypothetical protein